MTVSAETPQSGIDRRRVLGGAAVAVAGVAALAACGSSDESTTTTTASGPASEPGTNGALTAASAVPVGGGIVIESAKTVVTQPTAGQFKAFSAVCTHKGCLVSDITDGEIICPCHNSKFSATDGSVKSGPADEPLAAKPITVTDGQIMSG